MADIEVKFGSPTVTDQNGVSRAKVAHHISEIAKLMEAGHRVVVTAGGAIAQGRAKNVERLRAQGRRVPNPKKETDLQKRSYASRGSGSAYMTWEVEAAAQGIETAQVPTTTRETQDEEESQALRELLLHNLELGIVSVINGNDATSPEGALDIAHSRDNDKVAALVAKLLHLDHLCYLTDVDGLLDDKGIVVPTVTSRNYREALGFIREEGNGENGGMASKVTQAHRITYDGVTAHIGNAQADLQELIAGDVVGVGTHFPLWTPHNP